MSTFPLAEMRLEALRKEEADIKDRLKEAVANKNLPVQAEHLHHLTNVYIRRYAEDKTLSTLTKAFALCNTAVAKNCNDTLLVELQNTQLELEGLLVHHVCTSGAA